MIELNCTLFNLNSFEDLIDCDTHPIGSYKSWLIVTIMNEWIQLNQWLFVSGAWVWTICKTKYQLYKPYGTTIIEFNSII